MSSNFNWLDPLNIAQKKSSSPAPAAPVADVGAAEKAKAGQQMELRRSEASRALSAGGISGSDNEADTLGSPVKKRNASKALLGG